MNETTPPKAGTREWIGLAVLALPSLLVAIDLFVLLLALPHLSADLAPTNNEQLWILDVYGFLLAGFMITMGTLGDRIGKRRLMLIGAVGFVAASVLAAYSTSPEMLVAARALLGIAGAALGPTMLGLIGAMFQDPRQRTTAIGVWMVCMMGGIALGPVVGGVMLEHFWWGSVFLLGVPAMVLLLVLGPILLPPGGGDGRHGGRLDLASVGISLAAILPGIYGLKELARNGWEVVPLAALGFGVAMGVVFVRRQRRLADPLLDLRLFASRAFTTALVSMLVNTMLPGATMVLLTQFLQLVEGLSPLDAGLALVPAALAGIVSVQVAPLLARRIRPAHLIAAGMAVAATGLVVVTQSGTAVGLVAGFALINFGTGPLITLGTNIVIGAVPPEKAGSAASISQVSNEFGFALGIATMGSLAAAVYRSDVAGTLPAGAPAAARDTLAGAAAAVPQLPGPLGEAVLASARAGFTSGLHAVAAVSAVLVVGVAVAALVLLRHVPTVGSPAVAAPAKEAVPAA
ncbi:MFS transporter [Phytohabitans sp. ZYX-F-186]|uniref:MFS transporter n=1 Tax=Phytohabitans maris TaxID=3071409 RepID=A0ABU0ZFT8_9ACTN|nr:MFS transporter [Phytohabitans sp. ZYX-F-186]MDQ7905924.1 MFS transporter [Phytohabitans sp. ZYX-F-186]